MDHISHLSNNSLSSDEINTGFITFNNICIVLNMFKRYKNSDFSFGDQLKMNIINNPYPN